MNNTKSATAEILVLNVVSHCDLSFWAWNMSFYMWFPDIVLSIPVFKFLF